MTKTPKSPLIPSPCSGLANDAAPGSTNACADAEPSATIEGRCVVAQDSASGAKHRKKKTRHDGWTPARRITFLATLRQTGCVRDACRVTAMSSTSAYRLRKKDADFATRWDDALDNARRGLLAVAHERAVVGKEIIIIRGGVEVERRIMPSDSMLALLIKQGDLDGKIGNRTADKILTLEEWEAGHRFGAFGKKYIAGNPSEIRRELDDRLRLMRERIMASGNRNIDIHTGAGITQEVYDAVIRFGVEAPTALPTDVPTSVPRLGTPPP